MHHPSTSRLPLIAALIAMMAHALVALTPARAMTAPDTELSLTQALAVVCTADGAMTDNGLTHQCGHCTLCPAASVKLPDLLLVAIIFATDDKPASWHILHSTLPDTAPLPFERPPGQAPPASLRIA